MGAPVVVFRGDVVVWPERVYDAHRIQVSVPEVYRSTTPGELSLTVRTDKGGNSAPMYIRFVAPPVLSIGRSPLGRVEARQESSSATAGVGAGSAATPGPRANISDRCLQGFVWREAAPSDHVCVPPETRARVARQNQEALSHRLPNGGAYGPNTCVPGYVWREAFAGDVVCVTPEERAQAAEDNRLAPGRVAH